MKSTIESFTAFEQGSFKPEISKFSLTRIEEAIFRAAHEYLRREYLANGKAHLTMPWGEYTVTNHDKGNVNITFEPGQDFLDAINDPNEKKAVFMDDDEFQNNATNADLGISYIKLFTEFVLYGTFINPETGEPEDDSEVVKGINLTEYQTYYFPNRYAMMIIKTVRDHRAEGEIYQMELCDTVPHGIFEFEYTADDVSIKFIADKSFKQCFKDDKDSDGIEA